MKTTKTLRIGLFATTIIAAYAGNCLATPTLQLNISGGTYDLATQTVVAPTNTASNVFKLYAYLIEDSHHGDLVSDTYYISMAISPQISSGQNLGSFVFSGQTVNVSSGMTYGTPPADAANGSDLPSHGAFPTYFAEWAFMFNPSSVTQEFNTQDNPGLDPTSNPYVNRPMFYKEFDVDVSNLDPRYAVHFDLYGKQDVLKSVSTSTDNPGAYVPASPESCTNGSTSYPQCTITTTTTTDYPSAYRAAYTSCKKGNESGPSCVDNKGRANSGDVIVHPESCTNGSSFYPTCSLTTTTTTHDHSAYVAALAQSCSNGSRSYPNCTTTTASFVPSGEFAIKSFAPFSHDAEGSYHPIPVSASGDGDAQYNVPEANSVLLLGAGLLVVGIAKRKLSLGKPQA